MLRHLAPHCRAAATASRAAAGNLWMSTAAVEAATDAEKQIAAKIQQGLQADSIRVQDTSGGCGAMYSIEVVSGAFAGKSIVKQHQLVTQLLKEEIAQWHGFTLVTKPGPAA